MQDPDPLVQFYSLRIIIPKLWNSISVKVCEPCEARRRGWKAILTKSFSKMRLYKHIVYRPFVLHPDYTDADDEVLRKNFRSAYAIIPTFHPCLKLPVDFLIR